MKFYLMHWLHTKRRFIHIFSLSFDADLIWQKRIKLWDTLNIQIARFPLNYLLCNTFTSWNHVKVNLIYKTKVKQNTLQCLHCNVQEKLAQWCSTTVFHRTAEKSLFSSCVNEWPDCRKLCTAKAYVVILNEGVEKNLFG